MLTYASMRQNEANIIGEKKERETSRIKMGNRKLHTTNRKSFQFILINENSGLTDELTKQELPSFKVCFTSAAIAPHLLHQQNDLQPCNREKGYLPLRDSSFLNENRSFSEKTDWFLGIIENKIRDTKKGPKSSLTLNKKVRMCLIPIVLIRQK